MTIFRSSSSTPYTSIDYFVQNSFLGKAPPNDTQGFLKPSRFGIKFTLPNGIFGANNKQIIEDFLTDNVESIDIPSITLTENQVALRHQLTDRTTQDITAVFFESPGMSIKHAMWTWINTAIQRDSDIANFSRKYLDEISGQLEIIPILRDGEIATRTHKFDYVFPISTNPFQFNIGTDNEIGKMTVRFKYRYHTIDSGPGGFGQGPI